MKTAKDLEMIEREIKKKRKLMIDTAKLHGFTNEKTLEHSQELDVLINEYQRSLLRKKERNVQFYTEKVRELRIPYEKFISVHLKQEKVNSFHDDFAFVN